jgi:DNA (cytosine-5)-methyltransferase 1
MKRRPRLLDAFCGEGGAGVGYSRAGFDVTGVDRSKARLKLYPFRSYRTDAVDYILEHGHDYDLIHASPTCTGYSAGTRAVEDRLDRYDRLIPAVRAACQTVGVHYVIENVEGARDELVQPALYCGRMFGLTATDDDGTTLTLDRHRLFETSLDIITPAHALHDWRTNREAGIQVAGSYGGARRDKVEAREVRGGGYVPASVDVQRALLGTPWMSEKGCQLSIPPAYTEHLGRQLLDALAVAA